MCSISIVNSRVDCPMHDGSLILRNRPVRVQPKKLPHHPIDRLVKGLEFCVALPDLADKVTVPGPDFALL